MSTMLYLLVSVIAFAITAALGKWMIPFLHKLKFGQTIREVGPSWHKNKQGDVYKRQVCVCGRKPQGRLVYKKGLAPSAQEVAENPRARSARLRVIEKLPQEQ